MASNKDQDSSRLVTDCPDSLQDLCIFYCMNNPEILIASLNNITDTKDDITSSFSLLLGNRLLEYYLSICLPSDEKQDFVDQLTQNNQLCNEVRITRRDVLIPDNVQELANNSIKRLQLTVFDEDSSTGALEAYKDMLENSLHHLTSLSLRQKCQEDLLTSFLNLLCGREFDADVDELSESEDELDDTQVVEDRLSKDADENQSTFEVVVSNTKYHGFQIRKLDTDSERSETDMEVDRLPAKHDQVAPNLKSFSYEQVYSGIDQRDRPSLSYGWFYQLLSKILLRNHQIQSFSLVTIISNPIEWFLSQPKLPLLKNLESLCLSQESCEDAALSEELLIPYTRKFFTNLPVLVNLRHLDISCDNPGNKSTDRLTYDDTMVELFIQSVKSMPQLKSLDISGSNLSTIIGHADYKSETECKDHCMPGFEGRRFDFLGLYGNKDACRHKFIPARRVSGDATLDQLLVALWSLQHNKAIMSSVLQNLHDWVQDHLVSAKQGLSMIDGLVAYMNKIGDWDSSYSESDYYEERSICIILHTLYFLLRNDVKKCITTIQKRQLTEQLLVICHALSVSDSWQSSNREQPNKIIRVAMLLILILDLETVAVYSYRFEQYIQVLWEIFKSPVKQTQKLLSLRLIHSACRISQEYKAVAGGKMQLVKKLLMVVWDKVIKNQGVDDIMEKVWSIIWTLTDEVPSNCELFVHNAGCQMAKTCIENYIASKSLHRKITGAMNNVSENASLIPLLMTKDLVVMFRNMLSYHEEEDYDVSSHAAGFLVMLASHGPEAWIVEEPSRDTMLEEVDEVMKKWDINKPKGVKFRSLNPMLSQLDNYSTPVAQLWGAWLICNLVIVKPRSYCDMLESEDGLSKIDRVLQHGELRDDLVNLLTKIKTLTTDYKEGRARNEQMEEDDDD